MSHTIQAAALCSYVSINVSRGAGSTSHFSTSRYELQRLAKPVSRMYLPSLMLRQAAIKIFC